MVKDIESKRVNFSARTVITPDPTLSLNELGVPIAVAKNLTFPEITTPYNIEYLQKLVRNGRNKYPGANFVIKATNPDSPYDIRYTKNIELKYGDIVERHLINGDFVLFNRQPTLHKQSMMGHKIRVIDNPNLCTFRLNPMATTPYNADFDGDEMNMHAPQSIQAQIELEEIADVKLQLIKPQSSAPSVGMKQEFMLGAYNLSYDFTKIDWRTVMNIITSTSVLDLEKITKNKEYSGKELFSYIIPKNINMSIPNKINIKNGIMTEGIIDGASLGEGKPGNLVQLIWDEYGYEEAKNFMDNTTRMVNNFNLFYGFTVGIKDLDTSEDFRKQLYQTFNTKKLEVNHDITEAENNPDLTDETILEYTIKQKLDNIRDDVSNLIMKNLPANNNFKIMIDSGAKGKPLQMCQMAACVGQQDFMGARMPKNYNNRTLPYYHQHNDSAEARGFIQNSFYSGLNLPEFIFQSITSRSGLIDQAVKTAQSGYIQRKLIKSVEDFMIKYDGTVRNAVDRIQQFIYGDSGVDTIKQHKYKFKLLEFSNKEMEEKYKLTKEELGKVKNYSEKENEEYLQMMIENRDKLRMTQRKATLNYIVLDITYFIPVNIERIVNNAKNNEEIKGDIIYDPKYIIDFIENILKHENTQLICMSEDENKDVNSIKRKDEMISKTAFRIALYDLLAPKKCIFNYKFTKGHYELVSKHIISSFNKAIIQPGEMTGIIAAQSLGEPVTQMMLNSLDWIEEILIRDTKNNKDILKPIGEIIDEMIENNKDKVKEMGDNLENNMKQIYYLDITDKEYYIKSVDKYGKIEWKQITAITKHLPINKDGSNKLIKVITKNNKSVIATKGKSFLTMKDNLIVPIRGDEIQVNDYLPIDKNNIDNINNIESNNIIYPNINLKYIKGKISKYNLELIKDNLKDNKEDYEIINRIINSDVYWDKIVSIEEIEPSKTYVYDLTVEDNKTFIIRNGICCMDSFHSAGIAGKGGSNLGVGRLSEVLSLSKNPKQPMMIVYFDKENRFNKNYANKIASYIKLTMIKDIRNDIEIYYDPKPYEKGGIMESDNVYNVFHPMSQSSKTACSSSIDGLPWLLRITFDKEKLLKKEVSLLDIKSNLCLAWEKRYIDSKSMKREKKMVLDKITQMAILSNTDNDDVPTIHIRFDMMNFNSHTLIDFVDIYIDEFKLKGMLNITDVQGETATEERLIEFNEDGSLDKREEYVIYTEGINMNAIRKINGIDMNRTFCSDIITTFEIFGIEAARNLIIRDITNVMISNGSGVNFQHVSQFADLMTNMGTLTSIDRNGINKLDTDPFSRASFEKTVDQLITSAVFGEVDYMKSVSSRIMAGLCIKGGTGLCNVVIDNDLLKNSEYTTDIGQLYKNTFETITNNMNKLESEDNVFIPEI
jgi:DNA-directed RNA polymerase beta' subunit